MAQILNSTLMTLGSYYLRIGSLVLMAERSRAVVYYECAEVRL